MKTFAVIDKKRDCLVAFPAAQKKSQLVGRFPVGQFDLVDMTGKDGPPVVPGLLAEDVTVNPTTKEWKVKGKTVEERANDSNDAQIATLRHRIVDLEVRKDKAEGLGAGYAGVVADLQTKIKSTKTEITELGG